MTGSAQGPFAIYAAQHGLAKRDGDELSFLSRQGVAMGRPGTAHLRVRNPGRPDAAAIVGGEAVTLFSADVVC